MAKINLVKKVTDTLNILFQWLIFKPQLIFVEILKNHKSHFTKTMPIPSSL